MLKHHKTRGSLAVLKLSNALNYDMKTIARQKRQEVFDTRNKHVNNKYIIYAHGLTYYSTDANIFFPIIGQTIEQSKKERSKKQITIDFIFLSWFLDF